MLKSSGKTDDKQNTVETEWNMRMGLTINSYKIKICQYLWILQEKFGFQPRIYP